MLKLTTLRRKATRLTTEFAALANNQQRKVEANGVAIKHLVEDSARRSAEITEASNIANVLSNILERTGESS